MKNKFLNILKRNMTLKGLYYIFKKYFIRRKSFASFPKSSSAIPPLMCGNPKNVYIGPHVYIGPRACLSATNAKIIFKGHISVGEDLSIHTGNHARIIGMYHSDITESVKPKGYDKDVIIEEDVWIGSALQY